MDRLDREIATIRKKRKSRRGCDDRDVDIGGISDRPEDIEVADACGVLKVLTSKTFFDIDEVGIGLQIIVKNTSSSNDSRIFPSTDIDPCL